MKPPPPRFPASGFTTASARPVATAASTALPPAARMSTPTRDAYSSVVATIPPRAVTGGVSAWKGQSSGKAPPATTKELAATGGAGDSQPDRARRGRASSPRTARAARRRTESLYMASERLSLSCRRIHPSAAVKMLDDRLTEQRNPRSEAIDRRSSLEIVRIINEEDRSVADVVGREAESIARAVDLAAEAFRGGGRLIYAGAGTSGRLGVLDAAEMPPTFGTDPDMVQGVIAGGFHALVRSREGAEDLPEDGAAAMDGKGVGAPDFVIGIATSGTTPFVHGALARARELGARTGFLLCTPPPSALRDAHDVVIAPLTGPEVVTGSTRMKAGTATKMVLNTDHHRGDDPMRQGGREPHGRPAGDVPEAAGPG